jgi:DNA-binding beta-propeller fold protein YncE
MFPSRLLVIVALTFCGFLSVRTFQQPDLILSYPTYPKGIAIDPNNGELYVSDHYNRVLRFGPVSTLSSGSAPLAVFGQPNLGSSGAGSGLDQLDGPVGIFVDQKGTLWCADYYNTRLF